MLILLQNGTYGNFYYKLRYKGNIREPVVLGMRYPKFQGGRYESSKYG